MNYSLYTSHTSDWISFLLIGLLFSYGTLQFFRFINLKEISLSLFSGDNQESINSSPIVNAVLNLNTALVFSLILYSSVNFISNSNESNIVLYFRIICGLLVLLALQKLSIKAFSLFTNTINFFEEFITIQANISHAAGVLSLPFLIGSFFLPNVANSLLAIAMGVFGLVYILGTLKTIGFSRKLKGPLKSHIILYLCGNELLPLLLLYKLII